MQVPGFENAKYHLRYQPIVCIAPDTTISVVALEAFLRVEQPGEAPMQTDSFLAMAREKGEGEAVGIWVLHQACADLTDWRDEGYRGRVAINVSPAELTLTFVAEVQAALNEYGFAGNLLLMDITLDESWSEDSQAMEAMDALRRLGIRLYLDGAGSDFPLQKTLRNTGTVGYKTGRIPNMREEPSGIRMQELMDYARQYGREVIASRVETIVQRDLLLSMGCHIMQGYFFSKPVAAEAALKAIRMLTVGDAIPRPISIGAFLEQQLRAMPVSVAA